MAFIRVDFGKLKGLEPKNKGHTNFYECCDLTKEVYLMNSFQNWADDEIRKCGTVKILFFLFPPPSPLLHLFLLISFMNCKLGM